MRQQTQSKPNKKGKPPMKQAGAKPTKTPPKKKKKEVIKIITPKFRVSFPHLFEAHQFGNQEPRYSVTMLFEKDQDLSTLRNAIRKAKIAAFGPNEKKWPKFYPTIQNGDEKQDLQGYADHFYAKAWSSQQPGVVDYPDRQDIVNPREVYAGCYGRAQVTVAVWEYMGKHGVNLYLDNFQKLEDGESFGGRDKAEDAFGDDSDDYSSDGEESDYESDGEYENDEGDEGEVEESDDEDYDDSDSDEE